MVGHSSRPRGVKSQPDAEGAIRDGRKTWGRERGGIRDGVEKVKDIPTCLDAATPLHRVLIG